MPDAAAIAEDLYDRVRGCVRCSLGTMRTRAVPGEGPLDAEVMFIGEAPGVNEDKQGRPFVGAAGGFLEELLAAAGLRRGEVYITNVLKCRPPGNRDPRPEEIEACRDYLDEQIDLIDPLVIVTLGRFSMAKFFPGQSISRIHGQPKEVAGRFYVPMYHPAAALHQANLRDVIVADFAKLQALLVRARRSVAPHVSLPAATEAQPVAAEADPAPTQPPRAVSATQTRLFD
ncbi:MAG: uracil-DNA glycosylase [Chloroflexi bacterium]|nr:uracil-DNA glycosylase [Chloroflexota bacterium]